MTIKQSPLELRDIMLLNLQYSFIRPSLNKNNTDELDVGLFFSKYEIDINFAFQSTETIHQIFVKASINQNNIEGVQYPGYDIFCECMGVFEITNKDISVDEKQSLLTNSGLVMILNFLRTEIANVTGCCPFGKYLLPSIDLRDLMESKKNSLEEQKELPQVKKIKKKIK